VTIRAIIPARFGSERIPKKNLEKISGISLVRQSALVASKSTIIDITYLDTDSEEIINECVDLDVQIPGIRPAELSSSLTSTFESTMYFLTETLSDVEEDDVLILLQPTCPFRTTLEIAKAIELFSQNQGSHPVICVSPPFAHPRDLFFFSNNGIVRSIFPVNPYPNDSRVVFDTGSVYVTSLRLLRENESFVSSGKTLAIETNQIYGFDIDTPLQLTIARLLVASGHARLQDFPE
jgi:CMP-N-acetylneuraminic acid synthetase